MFRELVKEISGLRVSRPVVAVTGPGGAGKTTLGRRLKKHFGERCVHIDFDDYMISRREKRERGITGYHPEATRLDIASRDIKELKAGRSIFKPRYDFLSGEILSSEKVDAAWITVITGVSVLYDSVRELVDYSVYLDMSLEEQLRVRMKRDVHERGYTSASVLRNFEELQKEMKWLEDVKY